MSGFTKLWIDDVRPIPKKYLEEGCWCWARNAYEALLKLELLEFEEISVDHDLATFVGNKELNGYDIICWLVQRKHDKKFVPPVILVHSANIVGAHKMQEMIDHYLKD